MASARILMVEDDADVAKAVRLTLQSEGYQVDVRATGPEGLQAALTERYDAVILDVRLPGMSGFAVCQEIRRESAVPVLFLTARDEEADKVLGLELGADDYLTKPFGVRELQARVRALLRRAYTLAAQGERRLKAGDLTLWPERRKVLRGEEEIQLTPSEFTLLLTLARRAGAVVSKEELLQALYDTEATYASESTVGVHIRHLREKLERNPDQPELIITVRGAGYRLQEADA